LAASSNLGQQKYMTLNIAACLRSNKFFEAKPLNKSYYRTPIAISLEIGNFLTVNSPYSQAKPFINLVTTMLSVGEGVCR